MYGVTNSQQQGSGGGGGGSGGGISWRTLYEDATGAASVELSEAIAKDNMYRITLSDGVLIPTLVDNSKMVCSQFFIPNDGSQTVAMVLQFTYSSATLTLSRATQYVVTSTGIASYITAAGADTGMNIKKVEILS